MSVASPQTQETLRLNIADLEKEVALDSKVLSNAREKLERYRELVQSNALIAQESEQIKEEITSLAELVQFLEKKQAERQRQMERLKVYLRS